ncbi:MAG: glycosyltransferase family 87 protein [Chloroflexota bacterium]|nr:DUF2029 domain-containing protein [Dehalococcoidia bacterium]MDW8254704.1 glycosyltransferase family 87 protein [Chloroflexota bacterium]
MPFDASGYTFATPYLYPPIFAGLARPAALLPYPLARAGWLLLNVVLVAAATLGLARSLGLQRSALAAAFLALIAPPTLETLLYGQVNALLYALLATAVALPRAAGVAIGAASAIKLFPAVMLLALARARQTRQLLAAALTGLLAGVAGLALAGPARTAEYLTVVLPSASAAARPPANQSIQAVVGRLLIPSQHRYSAFTADDPQLVAFPALLDLPALAAPVGWGLAAAVLATTVVMLWRRSPDAPFGAALLVSAALLVTPLVWDHYLVLLFLPVLFLLAAARQRARHWQALLAGREALALALAALFLGVHRFWKPLTLLVAPSPLLLSFGMLAAATLWLAVLTSAPSKEQ